MEKHAKDDSEKATFVLVCIESLDKAKTYKAKHNLKDVLHLVAKDPTGYKLSYIPPHVVIDKNGKIKFNYKSASGSMDYMEYV